MSIFKRALFNTLCLNSRSNKKKSFILLITIMCFFTGVSLSAKPILTSLKADLMPITNNFHENGVVFVINQGSQRSKSAWLTLTCSGACPDHPSINAYNNPLFPSSVTLKIPALKVGQVFKHKLVFWDKVSFGPGKAKVLFFVDASNLVAETNEANNKKTVVLSGKKTQRQFGFSNNMRSKK